MVRANDGRILFLIKALVALLFISKISLGSILPIPRSFSYFIFQQGLHPFMNVLLCFLFGMPLVFLWLRVRGRHHLSGFYKLFILVMMSTLFVQTFLQTQYVNSGESMIMQLGALFSSLFMIGIYGLIIPSLWDAEDFLKFVQRWSGILVLISLILFVVAGGQVFKGGRFVGIFKHIPHMVTCATVAFVFSLGTFLQAQEAKHKIWNLVILFASFLAIILTGTRSSAAAAVMAFVVTMILHKTQTNQGRIFKFAFISFAITFTTFFGAQAYDFARGVATGQSALGGREAQDGIASRWEEVERGSQIFLQEPWLGHGLLSKFAAGNDVDVSNYNAMKDPHNIFISAGVVGGWPLLVISVIGVIFMLIGALKAVKSHDISKRQIAVYLLAHLPILLIYHIHLSIGGMADRLYWLVIGFVAASTTRTGKS
ncbi:O-antigen ligase family protein [Bdellovibrio reynosensis]|uniref:O-antigen ligase family protein n=1 Tax=Bdellovibrio reynosensis TaxID=2835041 RepID=A0ABY4CBT1_9BACT|nr:O-antigen ligase family protein [Bdellovibrio reynosensis]UOF00973.1 O-antigen ligase family protein [Bdellovibrio reynosensis]